MGREFLNPIHSWVQTIGQPTARTTPLIGVVQIVCHAIVLHWKLDEDTIFPDYVVRVHLGVAAMASVAATIRAVASDRHKVRSF